MNRRSILLIPLLLPSAWLRAADPPLEYQVKAVCVLNAARFVSWPASAFTSEDTPFVIGILGDNSLGPLLEEIVKGEAVRHRKIVVRKLTPEEAAAGCHLLFISRSESEHLADILHTLGDAKVLTISDMEGFTEAGGMLGLALDHGKIRFELNPDPVRRATLKLDSQFLVLCRITKPHRP